MARSVIKKQDEFLLPLGVEHKTIHIQLNTSTVGTDLDDIVDYLQDNYGSSNRNLYFSCQIAGNIQTPSMGTNTAFIYGMINDTKTYGWVRAESFDMAYRGTRKQSNKFTYYSGNGDRIT